MQVQVLSAVLNSQSSWHWLELLALNTVLHMKSDYKTGPNDQFENIKNAF